MLSCRQHWILCRHSAVTFQAIFLYDMIQSHIGSDQFLINFPGSGDDVKLATNTHAGKHSSYRGGGGGEGEGVLPLNLKCTPRSRWIVFFKSHNTELANRLICSLLLIWIPPSTLSYSRSPAQRYDELEADLKLQYAIVRKIMRIRPNTQSDLSLKRMARRNRIE